MKKIIMLSLCAICYSTTPFAWHLPASAETTDEYGAERTRLNELYSTFDVERTAFKQRQAEIQQNTQPTQAIALIGRARDTAQRNKDKNEAYAALHTAIVTFDTNWEYVSAFHGYRQALGEFLQDKIDLNEFKQAATKFCQTFATLPDESDLARLAAPLKTLSTQLDGGKNFLINGILSIRSQFQAFGAELKKTTQSAEMPVMTQVLLPNFMFQLHPLAEACKDEIELVSALDKLRAEYMEGLALNKNSVLLTMKKLAIELRLARLDMLQGQENVEKTNTAVLDNLQLWILLKTEAQTSPMMPDDLKALIIDFTDTYVTPKSNGFAADRSAQTLLELAEKNATIIGMSDAVN